MEIIDIKPRGYCKGVVKAIKLALNTRKQHPNANISILGLIVHNVYVAKALALQNIKTVYQPNLSRLELLDLIDDGYVILSAHGSSQKIKQYAKAKGLKVLDAVCEDVISTHQVIFTAIKQKKEVIYIGKNNHPESMAVLENFPGVHFISQLADIDKLKIATNRQILITNQTTLSILEISELIQTILDKYPYAQFANEICNATRLRQQAVIKHSHLDAIIVVGDPASNNTQMLANIAAASHIEHIFKIETLHQLDLAKLQPHWKIGVTSGASTPNYLTNMVIQYLKTVDLAKPTAFPEIDLTKILI